MTDALEDTILSLDETPYRGSIRRTGAFANRGYRQIFVKNFTIVYRIDETRKMASMPVYSYRFHRGGLHLLLSKKRNA